MSTDFPDDLYRRFKANRRAKEFTGAAGMILAAVSGGADSTALLELLHKLRTEDGGFELRAAHFHHGLRPEADLELRHVQRLCENLGVECVVGRGDTGKAAGISKKGVHSAARELRYRFLAEQALRWKRASGAASPPVIATGHHLDDRVETLLMQLLSGAGIGGLAGIKPVMRWREPDAELIVVRPLIDFRRSELERYCRERNIDFVTDRSNFDLRYPRSRVRHRLLPIVEQLFGAGVYETVARSADLMVMTAELIEQQIEDAFRRAKIFDDNVRIVLDYEQFTSYLEIIRLGCLRRAAQRTASATARIKFERLRAADRYVRDRRSGGVELGGGAMVCVDKNRIHIHRSRSEHWRFEVHCPGGVEIPGWGRLEVKTLPIDRCPLPPPPSELLCDRDRTGEGPFTIEPAQPGDRMVPLGSSYRCKVTDILRTAGIPVHRRRYPVVKVRGEIIAVPPFRIAEPVKLTPKTRWVMVLKFAGEISP